MLLYAITFTPFIYIFLPCCLLPFFIFQTSISTLPSGDFFFLIFCFSFPSELFFLVILKIYKLCFFFGYTCLLDKKCREKNLKRVTFSLVCKTAVKWDNRFLFLGKKDPVTWSENPPRFWFLMSNGVVNLMHRNAMITSDITQMTIHGKKSMYFLVSRNSGKTWTLKSVFNENIHCSCPYNNVVLTGVILLKKGNNDKPDYKSRTWGRDELNTCFS